MQGESGSLSEVTWDSFSNGGLHRTKAYFSIMDVMQILLLSFQFAILLAIIFILEIAAGAVAYAYKDKVSSSVLLEQCSYTKHGC